MNRHDRGAPPALGASEPENAVRSTRRWRNMDANYRSRSDGATVLGHSVDLFGRARPRKRANIFCESDRRFVSRFLLRRVIQIRSWRQISTADKVSASHQDWVDGGVFLSIGARTTHASSADGVDHAVPESGITRDDLVDLPTYLHRSGPCPGHRTHPRLATLLGASRFPHNRRICC